MATAKPKQPTLTQIVKTAAERLIEVLEKQLNHDKRIEALEAKETPASAGVTILNYQATFPELLSDYTGTMQVKCHVPSEYVGKLGMVNGRFQSLEAVYEQWMSHGNKFPIVVFDGKEVSAAGNVDASSIISACDYTIAKRREQLMVAKAAKLGCTWQETAATIAQIPGVTRAYWEYPNNPLKLAEIIVRDHQNNFGYLSQDDQARVTAFVSEFNDFLSKADSIEDDPQILEQIAELQALKAQYQ
ncbi:MAG: hypothetical protein Q4D82_01490 [Neisseria sp.]|nr:hypothetical protein [Neisseria sp.]